MSMIKVNAREIEFNRFPNGELNMDVSSFPTPIFNSAGGKTLIDFKYTEDGDLIKLMFVRKYISSVYPLCQVILRIWQMPYQRMDRSEYGSPFSLKYVSEFINNLDFYKVEIVEPHSDVTPALIDNSFSNYINFNLVDDVIEEIGFDEEVDYIMFPDGGAASRYKNMKFKNVLIGHKDRDFKTGGIKKLDIMGDTSNIVGKSVLICDDLSSYGGTFNFSAKALREKGAKKVYLLVAHAENSIFKGELFDNIDKVFTTNSMLTEHEDKNNAERYGNQLQVYNVEEY